MPSVKVESTSNLPVQETFNKVKDMIANDPGLRKLDAGYQCQFDEAKFKGEAKGKQFTAQVEVQPAPSGSHVAIVVELPFLLSPFKGQVKSTLERKLQSILT